MSESFNARVKRAIAFMKSGRSTDRSFDNIFENHDGDYIVTAIHRASQTDVELAEKMYKYIGRESTKRAVNDLINVSDHELPKRANAYRKKCIEELKELMESLNYGSPTVPA